MKFFYLILFNILLGFLFFIFYNILLSDKIGDYAYLAIEKYTYKIIVNFLNDDYVKGDLIDDLIILNKDANDKILSVDFDMKKIYLLNNKLTSNLIDYVDRMDEKGLLYDGNNFYNALNGIRYDVPFFIITNSSLLSSYGPLIPMKLSFLNVSQTNIKTQVKEYGINNLLVELYVTIYIDEAISTPFTGKKINASYDILLASKLVYGDIPNYYGSSLYKEFSFFN